MNSLRLVLFLLRRHFAAFVVRAFEELEPQKAFVQSNFVDLLCDMCEGIAEADSARLIINMPPRHLKSFIVSICLVAWILGHKPGTRVVLVSYGTDIAERHIRAIRQIMKSPWYAKVFPAARISKTKDTSTTFETTAGGGAFATTIEGALTGRGGDLFIVDDPIKAQDAQYPRALEAVNEWVVSTLLSRLDDKSKGKIFVVMQRLHVGDLSGHLLERGGWDHLSLPAIATEDEAILMRNGRMFRRKAGDPLFPERETLDVLARQKETMGSYHFNAQYQQTPAPREGNHLNPVWLRTFEVLPPRHQYDELIQVWDLGIKDGDLNDYSACATMLWRYEDRCFYLIDMWRGRLLFPALKTKIIELAQIYNPRRILIEDAANGPAMIAELRRSIDIVVKAVKPEGNKIQRIIGQSAQIEAGRLFLPRQAPWLDAFLDEYRSFPRGKHDDMLDAVAYGLASRKGMVSPDAVVVAPESAFKKLAEREFGMVRWASMRPVRWY